MDGRKKLTIGFVAFLGVITAGLAISTVNVDASNFIFTHSDSSVHVLTMDHSNGYQSGGQNIVYTPSHNPITFTYSNASSSNTGHVTLSSNGVINNITQITSIDAFTCTYTGAAGALQFKLSYDNETWGGFTTITSGYTYYLDSNPYYIYIKASSTVTIDNISLGYSCVANPAAEAEGQEEMSLLGVFDFLDYDSVSETNGSSASTGWINEHAYTELNGTQINMASSLSGTAYQPRYGGIGIGTSKAPGTFTINLESAYRPTNVTIEAISLTSTNNTAFSLNGEYQTLTKSGPSTITSSNYSTKICTCEFTFDEPQSSLIITGGSSGSRVGVYRIYLYALTSSGPSAPEETIIGFTATDSNASNYYNDDVFDTANGLTVVANKTGGTTVPLSKGNNGYSYIVKNSNNVTIDTSKAFGEEGTYTLIVSYDKFISQEIQLNVGFRVALTGITVNSTTDTFNTAQKLSDYTSGITADLVFNKPSKNKTVSYSNFPSNNVSLTLLNPNGVTSDISSLFGKAGEWTIKVSSTTNPSIYGEKTITVNAIPVTDITLSDTEIELTVGGKHQLTTTVEPDNATNSAVTWNTSDDSVATVDENGNVTGVAAGTATITVSATDGSETIGTCTVTVIEPVLGPDEGEFTLLSSGYPSEGDYVIITSSASDNATTAMSKYQATNNRPAVETTISNSKINRTSSSEIGAFLVGQGAKTNTYSFYDSLYEGYLYAASSTGNQLKTQSDLTNNSSFSLSNSSGVMTAIAQGSNTRNQIRKNAGSAIFSCYGSGQNDIYFFTKTGIKVYPKEITISGSNSVSVGDTVPYTVNYTEPSNVNIKQTTWTSSDETVAEIDATSGVLTALSAGETTITASALGANNTHITSTLKVTVSSVAVTGVSLNESSISLTAGYTRTLLETVAPNNATNKGVTWSSNKPNIATVDGGVVRGVAAGTATITVTTSDGGFTATCTVEVTSSSGGQSTPSSITYSFTSKSWEASPEDWTSGKDGNLYQNDGVQVTSGTSGANATSPESFSNVSSVVVTYCTNTSKGAGSISISVGGSEPVSQDVTTSGGTTGREMTFTTDGTLSGTIKIEVDCTTNSIYIIGITINYTDAEINPTGITSIDPSSIELSPGGTGKLLTPVFAPSNANQNLGVTWSTSSEAVAKVDANGNVTAPSTASIGATATITATSTYNTNFHASCTVTIVESNKDAWTIMIYMCGSDLESGSGHFATSDINEILGVDNQPDDVNIIIETGGTSSWSFKYSGNTKIPANKLGRWHVENKTLKNDWFSSGQVDMGLQSTYESFLDWGLSEYPAEKVGVIFWNHGGAMQGVCIDQNYSTYDSEGYITSSSELLANEIHDGTKNSLQRAGLSKLEWVGYDACLMAMQDIATLNADYFNYMVSAQESESGFGWDYDNWLDDLYAKKSTENILKAICDSFINDGRKSSEETLSVCNLNNMDAYITAWENMSDALYAKVSSGGKNAFINLLKSCKYYGGDGGYDYYGSFDAKDFINKLSSSSTFNPGSSYLTAVLNAFANLVICNKTGTGAGNSNGLCLFFPVNSYCYSSTYYTENMTKLTNWRKITKQFGNNASW